MSWLKIITKRFCRFHYYCQSQTIFSFAAAARQTRDADQNRRREELQRRIEETRQKLQNVRHFFFNSVIRPIFSFFFYFRPIFIFLSMSHLHLSTFTSFLSETSPSSMMSHRLTVALTVSVTMLLTCYIDNRDETDGRELRACVVMRSSECA